MDSFTESLFGDALQAGQRCRPWNYNTHIAFFAIATAFCAFESYLAHIDDVKFQMVLPLTITC